MDEDNIVLVQNIILKDYFCISVNITIVNHTFSGNSCETDDSEQYVPDSDFQSQTNNGKLQS